MEKCAVTPAPRTNKGFQTAGRRRLWTALALSRSIPGAEGVEMDTISENAETPETKVSATYNADVLEPGKFVTPQKHTAEATPDLLLPQAFKSPLNFSTVTVEQLGITPESFTKNSSGKSLSSYLKKSRRRSTVGARGSPETNHLIRFIAQQRNLKNAERSPLAQGSDSVGSPALYRGVSSLRERISAFQSAFHSIQEDEKAADCPEPSQAEGRSTAAGLDQGNGEAPAFVNMRKRKRVTFGEDLSPELFDESLPANTPLRRGGTPARQKELSCVSPLLLEEPLVLEQLPQPDFDDKEENLENIEPLQISLTVLSPKKSSISETLSGTDDFSSSSNHTKIPSHNVRRLTRTSNRRTQLVSFTEENICNAQSTEVQPYKEKKINRKKCQETKRTNKVLPKKKQVLKSCRKKKGRGKKVSQKSLYGERDIASKKPLLSPIPELPEGSEGTPVPPGIQRTDSAPDTRTLVSKVSAGVPGAADKWEREDELKTKVENESGHSARASETEEHVVACGAAPRLTLQCREFSVAGQNEEELKLGTQDTFLVVTQGKQQCGVGSAAQKEFACLQDASLGSGKGPGRDREGVESPTAERGGVAPGGGRKCGRPARRRSACHSGAHSGHWERNGDRRPACVDSSAVRLGSAALCEELAASVEQAVQSRRGETRVRRSTRLQKDAEDQGLVWLSLPVPSSSQKNRRRTIGAFDSRALESLSPAREAAASGPPGASSHLPGKRRKSFCASALAGSQGAPQPPRFCLGSLEREGEGSYGSWKGSTLGES
ncbi:cell division cycle-associated protein 2 [Ctenodactylus gundi]